MVKAIGFVGIVIVDGERRCVGAKELLIPSDAISGRGSHIIQEAIRPLYSGNPDSLVGYLMSRITSGLWESNEHGASVYACMIMDTVGVPCFQAVVSESGKLLEQRPSPIDTRGVFNARRVFRSYVTSMTGEVLDIAA
jgi:hypothetical protein